MNKLLEKFLYFTVVLMLLNPFVVFVAVGCTLVQPNDILSSILWIAAVAVYGIGWYKMRARVGKFDSDCVRLYLGR